jgi:hypothetical protein
MSTRTDRQALKGPPIPAAWHALQIPQKLLLDSALAAITFFIAKLRKYEIIPP